MGKHLAPRSKYADTGFWVDAADRALASFAQAGLASGLLGTAGVLGVDWVGLLSISAGTALASILSSIAFRGKPGDNEDSMQSTDN